MKTRSSLFGVVLLTLATIFAASCGNAPQPTANNTTAQSATRGGTLSYRMTAPPSSFNYVMTDSEGTMLVAFSLLTSALTEFDHRTQKYVPGLAESWKVSEDGLTVTVKLRQGSKFSDGKDISSDDVVFTLRSIYDEKANAPVWKDAMLVADKPIEAKAIDPLTVELTFPKRVAAVENYLVNLGVLPAHMLKSELDAGKFSEAWKLDSDPSKIVSSGPFTVESVAGGERIVLKRNPNYWKNDAKGEQLPYLDKISLEITADSNNAMARLSQNTLDLVDRIRPADFATLSSRRAT
ncbi:MAG: hypothetical protein IPG58_05775 [Acidobacteria bacterium]|nr:hypothetical protein [Acidobacteriota bacterium]